MADSIAVKYASKAAGVYREIIDATQSELQTVAPCNVVVVIQSEYGPVMKPVLCADATQLHTMFGYRDANLESKGNYGILMAEHVLEQGPVWILNIKNINPQTETLMVKELACGPNEQDALNNVPINQVYDTNKFWNIPQVYGTYGDGAILSFSSVLNGTASVIVKRYTGDEYDYTVRETKELNEAFLGQGLDDSKLVSDYMIEVSIFKSDILNAKLSVTDAIVNGEVNLNKLDEIKADPNSKYYATYTGSVGNVIDKNGSNLNIVTLINADTYAHGIYAAVNMEAVMANGIDLIGENAYVFDETGAELPSVQEINRLGYAFTPVNRQFEIQIDKYNRTTGYFIGNPAFNSKSVFADYEKTVRLSSMTYIADTYQLNGRKPYTINAPVQVTKKPYPVNANGSPVYGSTAVYAGQVLRTISSLGLKQNDAELNGIKLHIAVAKNGILSIGAETTVSADDVTNDFIVDYVGQNQIQTKPITIKFVYGNEASFKLSANGLLNGVTIAKEVVVTNVTAVNVESKLIDGFSDLFTSFMNGLSISVQSEEAEDPESTYNITITPISVPKTCRSFEINEVLKDVTELEVTDAEAAPIEAPYLIASYGVAIVPVIVRSEELSEDEEAAVAEVYGDMTRIYKLVFDEALSEYATEDAGTLENFGDEQATVAKYTMSYLEDWYKSEVTYKPMVLTGIKSLEKHFVNGTAARQNSILDMLNTVGINNSFIDPTIFRCRYMVDTFKTYIEPNAKYQYATLAGNAKRFLVFTPTPFYYELLSSKNPDFHDLLGNFQMSYVKNGKNPDKPSTNSFYFVQDESSMYLVPVMNGYHNDGFSDTLVPYVGAVAKLYYSKHTGTAKVYDIVAGQSWPLSASGMTGPEFEPDIDQRAQMEQMGFNVVQTINGVTQLRSNKTAYQFVKSALNYPETLEKVFYVSDNVEPTLEGRQFKYNNADSRLTVKNKADSICDLLVADGAVSSYLNTCDLSNNTSEVRSAGIIVLDTELFNETGIRIAVHRSTIRTAEE